MRRRQRPAGHQPSRVPVMLRPFAPLRTVLSRFARLPIALSEAKGLTVNSAKELRVNSAKHLLFRPFQKPRTSSAEARATYFFEIGLKVDAASRLGYYGHEGGDGCEASILRPLRTG
jgi:hypothetical protein